MPAQGGTCHGCNLAFVPAWSSASEVFSPHGRILHPSRLGSMAGREGDGKQLAELQGLSGDGGVPSQPSLLFLLQ